MFSKKEIFLVGVLLTNEEKQLHIKPYELSTQKRNGDTLSSVLLTVCHSVFDMFLKHSWQSPSKYSKFKLM